MANDISSSASPASTLPAFDAVDLAADDTTPPGEDILAGLPPELWPQSEVDDVEFASEEGPIFICGLDDVIGRLEEMGGALGGSSGSTLEDLGDLLHDAGFTR